MNKYILSILLQVELDAYDTEDAIEVARDSFGEGEICGMTVSDFEIVDYDELSE